MSLLTQDSNIHVRLMSDNSTVVAYINAMGVSKSVQVDHIAREIWDCSIAKSIWISAAYVLGLNKK